MERHTDGNRSIGEVTMIHSSSEQQWAASGDTWGIAGTDFLNYYLVTAAVGLVVVLIARRAAFGGKSAAVASSLDPEQVGYLAGHRAQAYLTALTGLRTQGLVASAGPGKVISTHGPRGPLTELQQAILVVAAPGVPTWRVRADPRLTGPITRIRSALVSAGLLASREQQTRARVITLLLVVIEAVGVARAVAGAHNGKPYGNLAMTLFVLGVVTVILLAVVPTRTPAGTAALSQLRASNGHLRAAQHPSWATYGTAGAGLSVALFGGAAFFAIDPVFASEVRVPRAATSVAGSGSGGDGGGGSSCGGGGGSSCGGGGCGGGGCGG